MRYAFVIGLLALVVAAVVCGCKGKAAGRIVTPEEYQKVQTGMTYDEVVQIVGVQGQEHKMGTGTPTGEKVYSWDNSDGTYMSATFGGDGKLTAKTDSGLEVQQK